MAEIHADMRIWEIHTPDTDLRVMAEEDHLVVLSDQYQEQLKQQIADLRQQITTARTRLSAFEQKRRKKTLDDYAQPLDVWIEAHETHFLVWSDVFPVAALGETEEEALAAFHRLLSGYRKQLGTHKEKLSDKLQAEYELLNDLFFEYEKAG